MTDKEYRLQKQRVLKAFNKWRGPTGINEWIAYHNWYRDGTAGKDPGLPGDDGTGSTARATVRWQYVRVTFHWNLLQIADHDEEELDRIVRHEIAHVLVNEMRALAPPTYRDEQARDEAMNHEERVVTKLASILLWCRTAGQGEGKKKRVRRADKEKA